MKAIFKREMLAYFTSPIGFIFVGVFMALSGIFFGMYMFVGHIADINGILPMCQMVLVLIMPIITMRLLSEERANKTDQLLLTAPVKISSIVLGKFFAAYAIFLIAVATTLFYAVIAAIFGSIVFGEVILTYIAYLLLGALLIAIGLFISSLTESQIVAAVATYGVVLLLFFSSAITTNNHMIDAVLKYLNISVWANDFYRGVLAPKGAVYYLSFTVLFLILTVRSVESRRWK